MSTEKQNASEHGNVWEVNESTAKCPFLGGEHHNVAGGGPTNRDWWPNQLRLDLLHQHSSKSDPMGEDFDYAEAFKALVRAAVAGADLLRDDDVHRTGDPDVLGGHARDPREAPFQIGKLRSVMTVLEGHFKDGGWCRLVALVPASDNHEVAIAIYDKSLIAYLIDIFERAWERAQPFTVSGNQAERHIAEDVDDDQRGPAAAPDSFRSRRRRSARRACP